MREQNNNDEHSQCVSALWKLFLNENFFFFETLDSRVRNPTDLMH
jgi:hypothetical protein